MSNETLAGEAMVRDAFKITGRGFAVILEEILSGCVTIGQTLASPLGHATIKSVEFADVRDETGQMKGYVALVVDEAQLRCSRRVNASRFPALIRLRIQARSNKPRTHAQSQLTGRARITHLSALRSCPTFEGESRPVSK
jgi:hypothetical protein